jgi:hypothetical protein
LTDALGSVASVLFRVTVTAASVPPAVRPHGSGPIGLTTWIALGLLAVVAVGVLVLALRRRARGRAAATVEETELERIARGREYLLTQADMVTPRRPNELVAGWNGPPVAPEEWAEWIAALVTEGSLIPSRGPDHRLAYLRAAPRPATTAKIEFDPTVLETPRSPSDEEPDPSTMSEGRQGGG